jgi:hypothetical protein
MKTIPTHVCARTALLADLQQKVGELILSITSCPSTIILEKCEISV